MENLANYVLISEMRGELSNEHELSYTETALDFRDFVALKSGVKD